jgi:Ca2+-dependent lipid-binding protein
MDLIGYVDIQLSTINGNQFIEQWYPIQIANTKEKLQDQSIYIRIKAKYQTIEILTIESYLHLQEVFY